MMVSHPPKTLQMIIKEAWLVESIKNLGSGYYTHLAYTVNDIDPQVLGDIQNSGIQGVLGEIVKLDATSTQRVATVEVIRTNDFHSFIRFDLRLLEIVPFIKETPVEIKPDCLCCYQS
jgi:hypothetical protein